ncbi:Ail/Lom family outer membrane beta-barrel protein [Vibrio diazotrophicus]|nr:Ail/Lom family outer membrane beta-barrel protein [Vibrio diazotrophicus]
MKILSMLAVVAAFGLSSFSVSSEEIKQTVSVGYASSSAGFAGYELDDVADGFNAKYRIEYTGEYGLILSYTKTDYSEGGIYNGTRANVSLEYSSFMAGPTFRANEYFSVYLLVGGVNGKASASVSSVSATESETGLSYGGGLQINVTPSFSIDGSYEYVELNEVDVGTWVVGVGYSF